MKRVALLVAFGITAGLAVASPAEDVSAAKPKIRWQPCEAEGAEGFGAPVAVASDGVTLEV